MQCPLCATKNLPGDEFCIGCGYDLRAVDVPLPHDALSSLLLERTIDSIQTRNPVSVQPDDPIALAVDRMNAHNIRALVVLEQDTLVGILTERDLVLKLDPDHRPERNIRVRDLMTPDPVVVYPDEPLGTAMQRLCLDRIHHLPVVDYGRVVGIVAMRDLLHALVPALTGGA